MAPDSDDYKSANPPDLEGMMDVDSIAGSSVSDSDSEAPPVSQVEWLATGRSKRSTAGNRMKSMLANEEPADADSDLELLFQEDDDDAGFTDKGEDDASDEQMESSDDEDNNAAQVDDLEGEKELECEAREKKAAARKRKAQEAIPAKFRKKVRINHPQDAPSTTAPPPPKPRPKKKSERTSWLPTAADMPTRASERKTTRLSKEQLHQQMVEREARRKKQLEVMEKKAKRMEALKKPPMTQAERLKEAELVEKRNSKSLNRWEEAEKQREEERRAKLAALNNRRLEGPVVTFWSGIVDLSEVQLKHVGKMVSMEEKPKRKRPSTAATAATATPKAETPSDTAQGTHATKSAANTPPGTVTPKDRNTENPKGPETSEAETAPTKPIAATEPTSLPPPAVSSTPASDVPSLTTDAPARSAEASGPGTGISNAAPEASKSVSSESQPTLEKPSLLSGDQAHPLQTLKADPPMVALASTVSASVNPSTTAPNQTVPGTSASTTPAGPPTPVKIEPPTSKSLPLALRPDIGPRFMPPPNPHFAQPSPTPPSVLAPPAGMTNGSMPVLGYASTHVPRSVLPPTKIGSPVPTLLGRSPASNTPKPHALSASKSPTASPSPFQPPPQPQSSFHTTATFQPIIPPIAPSNSAKTPKKKTNEQAAPQKTSNKTLSSRKSVVPPEPPEPEPPLEGKVTRSCIILQNFDDEAVKKPEIQTQILFGRKMTKLASKYHVVVQISRREVLNLTTANAEPPHPPTCVITNHPARYRDPKTGLPFYNTYAFKEIQRLAKGDFKWSKLLGTWVCDGSEAAKGVPDRFIRPETEEERKEKLQKKDQEKKLAQEQKKKAEEEKEVQDAARDSAKESNKGINQGVAQPPLPVHDSSAPAPAAAPVAIPFAQPIAAAVPLSPPTSATICPPVPAGVPAIMPSPDEPKPAGPSLPTPNPVVGGQK